MLRTVVRSMNHLHAPAIDQICELDDALGLRRRCTDLFLEITQADGAAAKLPHALEPFVKRARPELGRVQRVLHGRDVRVEVAL